MGENVLETAHTDIICCPGAPSYSWAAQSHFGPVGGPALTPELLKDFGASATWKDLDRFLQKPRGVVTVEWRQVGASGVSLGPQEP